MAQALDFKLDDVASLEKYNSATRVATRKAVAVTLKATVITEGPLLLHWDGKLLPEIIESKETVDRVAVLVTGGQVE